MKKILNNIKEFWKKGKKQKFVIITIIVVLIAVLGFSRNDSSVKEDEEEKLTITFTIDENSIFINDTVEFDYYVKSNIRDSVPISDYDFNLNFDKEIIEYDEDSGTLKAIGIGTTEIFIVAEKDDKRFESNKISLTVSGKVVSISAKYNGSTKSDTLIDNNASIIVTGTIEGGEEININDWEIVNPGKLQPEETSTFQIKYGDLTCDLSITCTTEKPMTMGQSNAYNMANRYLQIMPFSRSGLIKQLDYEGFSTEDATFAVDKCNVDWNEQAAKHAKKYLDTMSFSRSGLIKQLKYEGYTQEQAEYGVSAVGY